MQLTPYLSFNGQCEAAFKFYEQCFGGKIEYMLTYESRLAEYPVPPEWHKRILHATLMVGDQVLMGADAPPDRYQKPQGFSLTLGLKDQEEAERIFKALADKGTVEMALQETFWAIRFGVLVDRFGIPWTVNCERPATPQAIEEITRDSTD
jgi:PhnB protein